MSIVSIEDAIRKLDAGDVVALPTETVYGLAGSAESEESLYKIFKTKKRPFFDPLIVHVKNLEQAKKYGQFDNVSSSLAAHFWPGPLTLVVEKTDEVFDIITNGGSTVAIRCPNHPFFLKVLKEIGGPLAAPSANMFGHTSPTEALHVENEFAGEVAVVDGGPCKRGIESTVVRYNKKERTLEILRPGVITQKDLQDFFSEKDQQIVVRRIENNIAPGHLKNHYQPTVSLALIFGEANEEAKNTLLEKQNEPWQKWNLSNDPSLAARELYRDLRNFSQSKLPIYIEISNVWTSSADWSAIMDRLQKAAHFELRKKLEGWQLTTKD